MHLVGNMMDKSMVDLYRSRWEAVAEIESIEQREASFAQRWSQLNAIIRMAAALGLPVVPDEEQENIVHQRWNDLRKLYLAESQESSHDLE